MGLAGDHVLEDLARNLIATDRQSQCSAVDDSMRPGCDSFCRSEMGKSQEYAGRSPQDLPHNPAKRRRSPPLRALTFSKAEFRLASPDQISRLRLARDTPV